IEQRLADLPAKLARYDKAITEATHATFPLTEKQTADLNPLQHILGLTDQDVLPIRTRQFSMHPKWFFEDIVSKVLDICRELCALIGGRYGFRVTGKGGGEWTVDYARAEVEARVTEDVDLYLEMPVGDFIKLLEGAL